MFLFSNNCCRTGFGSDSLAVLQSLRKIIFPSLEFTIGTVPIIPYIGVAFSFLGLLSLDCYRFDFLMKRQRVAIKSGSTVEQLIDQ